MNNKVINLAGVMGGKETACSDSTTSALIECAFFEPESIIGRSVKYDLNSGRLIDLKEVLTQSAKICS